MTVTGKFKSGRVSIPKVTGDVEIILDGFVNTSPTCQDGYGYSGAYGTPIVTRQNFSITPIIFIGNSSGHLGTGDVHQYLNIGYKFIKDSGVSVDSYYTRMLISYTDGTVGSIAPTFDNVGDDTVRTIRITARTAEYIDKVSFTLATAHIDDSYAYRIGDGLVIFAGRNTPYYGKSHIETT